MAISGAGWRAGHGRPARVRVAPRRSRLLTVALVLAAVALFAGATGARGQVTLGTAESFAVLANTTITNTGATTIRGNVGLYPGTAVTGFGTVVQTGTLHIADAVAQQALIDATTAYNNLQGRTPCTDLSGKVLGQDVGTAANPLPPGVYCFSSSAQLTGDLYLSGGGEYIFQIGSTLTTASGSRVILLNGANACNVFWAVGSSATLGTNSQFVGTIIANISITANTGAVIVGRLFALTGAVTLQGNTITRPVCTTTTTTTAPPGATTTTSGATTTAPPGATTTAPPATTTTTAIPVTTITVPGTTITVPGTTITVPGTTIVVPGTTIVVPGTTIVVPGITTLPPTTTTTTRPTTTTAIPGTTTTTAPQGTTTTLQPGGGGPGPGPTTTAAPATTTTGLQATTTTGLAATTTTTTAPATTTTARSATTTTVLAATTGTTAPGGGGTGLGAGGPDSLRAAGSDEALALTGPTQLQPMLVAALLAVLLGAMMLMSSGPGVGSVLVAAGPETSKGVTPLRPTRAQAQVPVEPALQRRDISPAEATRSALRSAESIPWTLRLPEK